VTERNRLEEQPIFPQQIESDVTSLVRSTVPDKYPTKESRNGVEKIKDQLHVVYASEDPEAEMQPVRIVRDLFPRVERDKNGNEIKSVMQRPYVIWFGDSKPYILSETGLRYEGKLCDDEQLRQVYSNIEALRQGAEDGSVYATAYEVDADISSDTLSKPVPIFNSSQYNLTEQ